MKDVEGKRPDSLKECWRWVRGLLHDFVNLKKLFNDYQRVIKKMELLLNINPNSSMIHNDNNNISISNKENSMNLNIDRYLVPGSSYNVT